MKRARLTPVNEVALNNTGKTELDLFTKPVEQNAILSARDFEYGCDYIITENSPIQFSLPVTKEYYTDLANIYLKIQLQVYKSDGTNLDEADEQKVTPVVGFFDSLFSRILLTINEVPIGSETANHPQLAYFRNLLNYGEEFKSGALKHTMGYGEEVKLSDGKIGFPTWRHSSIEKSRLLTMCTRLQNSFFNCSKLLVPHVPVRIRLDRNDAAFSLLTKRDVPDRYRINIRHTTLYVRKVMVAPHTVSLIEHRLASQPAVYPYIRTELRHFLIPSGSQSVKHRNVFTGQLPTRLLFAVCPTLGVSGGDFHNNPLVFDASSFGVNYVQFFLNEAPVSFNAFKPNFDENDYVMSYVGLLRALRLMNSPQPICPVTYDSFGGPNAIFGVDLSADMTNLAMPAEGDITVEVRFKNNVNESLNGIVVAEYRSCVFIDKNGIVTQKDL